MGRNELSEVLAHVKQLGFQPHTIIDVGIAYGTPGLYGAFDDVKYLLVEPLAEYEHVLQDICARYPAEYALAAAGAKPGKLSLNVHPDLSGSSFFKESEGAHIDGQPREVPVITLDNFCGEKKAEGPYVLKVDTQGADLEVLAGAEKTLEQTELILLEAFLFQFYQGIPLIHDIVAFMKERGFVIYDIFGGNDRLIDNALAQVDLAFVKERGIFRQTDAFATPEQRAAFTQKRKQHLNPQGRAANISSSAKPTPAGAGELTHLTKDQKIERILLLRSGRMDIVSDAVAALQARFPEARLDALTQPVAADELGALDYVRKLHLYDQGVFDAAKMAPEQLAQLREQQYDLVVLIYSDEFGADYWQVQVMAQKLQAGRIVTFNRSRRWSILGQGAQSPPAKQGAGWSAGPDIEEQLRKLKDIHRGKRAFIIGMGPSLQNKDLDRLQGELTFACNKIYLAFDQTEWRPTYYSVIDILVAKNNYSEICNLQLNKIFTHPLQSLFCEETDIDFVLALRNPGPPDEPQIQFSKDLLQGTYGGHTVIYFQMQLAYHMGIRELYLLGLDFSFTTPGKTGEKTSHGEDVLVHQGEQNHFHPNYRKPGEKWSVPQLDYQRKAFQCAKGVFEKGGGCIYNASRQTKLEVFPRIDFEQLIKA